MKQLIGNPCSVNSPTLWRDILAVSRGSDERDRDKADEQQVDRDIGHFDQLVEFDLVGLIGSDWPEGDDAFDYDPPE